MAISSKLTPRARRFVEEYLVDHNATQAIVRAGFTGTRPDIAASKLMAVPAVAEHVEKRVQDKLRGAGVRADRVLQELAAIAFSDASAIFDQNGNIKPASKWDEATRAALAGIEVERTTRHGDSATEIAKVKRWDKLRALELIGKHLAMFVDRTELTGKDGVPLAPPVINIGFANGGPGDDGDGDDEG